MAPGEFKSVTDGSLFGKHYYRTLTFWEVPGMLLLAMVDVVTFAADLHKHDHSLFIKVWPPLLGLAVLIVLGGGLFALWLSRMRVLFSGAENIDVTAIVKKTAGDFLRLFALLILCVYVGLFVAQKVSGY